MPSHSKKSRPKAPAAAPLATLSNAPHTALRTLEKSIGDQVRKHRKLAGLTVAALSATAEISPGMLSKIENGQISPSLSTMQMLSRALNIHMTALFASYDERRDCSHVRAGEGVTIRRRGTKAGHQYQLLGHSLEGDLVIEPYLITLASDAAPYTAFQHQGVEFIFMLAGEVEYAHADRLYRLSPGDAILFDSAAPHGPSRLIKTPMTFLSIIAFTRR